MSPAARRASRRPDRGDEPAEWVVLLKGGNTGGNVFRPSLLPKALPRLGLVSLGAAGTFVAASRESPSAIRTAIAHALPFRSAIMVVPATEIRRMLRLDPAAGLDDADGTRKFLTVAERPLPAGRPLPIAAPERGRWAVRIVATDGPFAAGVCRRIGPQVIYPNTIVEREFGVPATTRWWETFEALCRRFRASDP
ncbi:MAG TPA: hypothetical protein VML94_06715 [Thermoplasmata archaeon]|nr:hypothetical protein [Thermoplasmata archaeon]